MVEDYFKPLYYVQDIEPSSLEDNEGKWVELKNIEINSFVPQNSGSLFVNGNKNGKIISIYIDSRVGINIAKFQEEFKKGDFINVIGISSIYSANNKKVAQLRILKLNDITLEK